MTLRWITENTILYLVEPGGVDREAYQLRGGPRLADPVGSSADRHGRSRRRRSRTPAFRGGAGRAADHLVDQRTERLNPGPRGLILAHQLGLGYVVGTEVGQGAVAVGIRTRPYAGAVPGPLGSPGWPCYRARKLGLLIGTDHILVGAELILVTISAAGSPSTGPALTAKVEEPVGRSTTGGSPDRV